MSILLCLNVNKSCSFLFFLFYFFKCDVMFSFWSQRRTFLQGRLLLNWLWIATVLFFQQDSIQKILLSLTSRIAGTHIIHEKRRVLSMYRLFVLLLLKDLPEGLGNTWAFFIRDVIYSLLRIISDETQVRTRSKRRKLCLVVDEDLFSPCCNLMYHVSKAAVDCCSQVRQRA